MAKGAKQVAEYSKKLFLNREAFNYYKIGIEQCDEIRKTVLDVSSRMPSALDKGSPAAQWMVLKEKKDPQAPISQDESDRRFRQKARCYYGDGLKQVEEIKRRIKGLGIKGKYDDKRKKS